MEMVVIGIIAILLFGNRLPEVAKSIGKGFNEFKKGMHGIDEEINTASRPTSSSTTRASRAIEDREDTSGPKFEPPPAEGAA
jgi:sec-independent protein translocase protein TatA